jgi:predicted RNase H-like HicB family nuclease
MNQASAHDAPLRIRVGRYVGVFAKTSTGYSAHVPSIPGLAVTGATLEETIEQLRTGIPAHLEALAQDKIERPWLYKKQHVG